MLQILDAQVLDSLDQKIKQYSQHSTKAPAEFLESEFRRSVNKYMVRFGPLEPRFSSDRYFENIKDCIEREYQCYFETEKFLETLRPSHWWKFTYAGCNAQIEHFLIENDFAKALETIGDAIETSPTRTISNTALPDTIRRYLIGIGYLYPSAVDTDVVHSNMLLGQLEVNTPYATMDSPFLTRDLIRCPYHAVLDKYTKPLSDHELWEYWKDILALSLAGLPEHILYRPEHFRKEEPFPSEQQAYLDIGRKLVPQRYVALEHKIETFSWCFPPSEKEK